MAASSPRRRPVRRPIFTRPPNGPPMPDAARHSAAISASVSAFPCSSAASVSSLVAAGMRYPARGSIAITPSDNLAVEERAQMLSELARRSDPAAALDPLDGVDQGHAVELCKIALQEMAQAPPQSRHRLPGRPQLAALDPCFVVVESRRDDRPRAPLGLVDVGAGIAAGRDLARQPAGLLGRLADVECRPRADRDGLLRARAAERRGGGRRIATRPPRWAKAAGRARSRP